MKKPKLAAWVSKDEEMTLSVTCHSFKILVNFSLDVELLPVAVRRKPYLFPRLFPSDAIAFDRISKISYEIRNTNV